MNIKRHIKITKTHLMQLIFILLNLLFALYISYIFNKTTKLICYNDDARQFLEQIKYIPVNPESIIRVSFLLFTILFIMSILRILFQNKLSLTLQTIMVYIDILICVTIMFYLNLSNKEMLLIPIVHTLLYLKGRKRKTILTIFIVSLFTILDSDFLSIPLNLIPIEEYINYNGENERLTMYGIRSVLISLNYIWFIFFIFFDIQFKIEENRRVKHLNRSLNSSLDNLEMANKQLIKLSKQSGDLAKVKERNRLAREIHDTIGHTLIGIELGLKACRSIPGNTPGLLLNQIDKITELATKGSKDIRFSLKALKPDALQKDSVIPAIKIMLNQLNDCGDVNCTMTIGGDIPRLLSKQEELIYRIVQEAITNAIRHGKSKKIYVHLEFTKNDVFIDITDDGIGGDKIVEGFGIKHLRDGLSFYKGSISILKENMIGLVFRAYLPIIRSQSRMEVE